MKRSLDESTNKPKEYTETLLIHFNSSGGLSQSEEDKFMWTRKDEMVSLM